MKTILLNLFLLITTSSFSQTYKCEFTRSEDGKRLDTKTAYHTVNSETAIKYYELGFEVKLETIQEGDVLSYYIAIYHNNASIGKFDLRGSESSPENFLITYTLPDFSGECECNKEKE